MRDGWIRYEEFAANVSQLLRRTRPGKNNEKLPLALGEFIANQSS